MFLLHSALEPRVRFALVMVDRTSNAALVVSGAHQSVPDVVNVGMQTQTESEGGKRTNPSEAGFQNDRTFENPNPNFSFTASGLRY